MPENLTPSPHKNLEIPALIQDLTAVIAVIFDQQGFLIKANEGFLNILNQNTLPEQQLNIRELFIAPNFTEFSTFSSSNISEPVYHGIMNIGNKDMTFHSVIGSVYKSHNNLLIIAEYDIKDLEQLTATVIELNDDLVQTQRYVVNANRALKRNEARITELTLTDQLTGIANRRHYDQRIKEEVERSIRYQQHLCLVMCDIDFFKRVNDDYGHQVGDDALRQVSKVLRKIIHRTTDLIARYGGEEFAIILPNTDVSGAYLVAEKIRENIAEQKLKADGIEFSISVSIGLMGDEPSSGDSSDYWLKEADDALYKAKDEGRNKVVLASSCSTKNS